MHEPTIYRNGRHDPRHALGLCVVVVGGCILFAASRKLVWGREESLAEVSLWGLATIPYLGYFAARQFGRSLAFVRETHFLSIWTVSLLAFVLLRGSTLSRLYENSIYDAFGPGLWRYLVLSALYIGFGVLLVTVWRRVKGHVELQANDAASYAVSFVAGMFLFCCGVFLIAL